MPIQTQQTDPSITNQIKTAAVIGGNILLCSDKPRFISPDNARQLAKSLSQSTSAAENSIVLNSAQYKAKRTDKEPPENLPEVEGKLANNIVEIFHN